MLLKTKKNKLLRLFLSTFFALNVFSIQNVFSQKNTIYVENGKIFTSCNEEVVMRGYNEMFIWSQDRKGEVLLPEMAKTGANAVRLVWTTQGNEAELDALINNSIKNKMIPVPELHDATGNFGRLQELVDYWKRPAVLKIIQKYKRWVIVNIGNEVGGGGESVAQWVAFYKDAITQLRDAGIDTPLMIDCGSYGNEERYFLEGGEELLQFDPEKNLIFGIHTYWQNPGDTAKLERLERMISTAKTKKLPYVIGEGPQLAASPSNCSDIFPYKQLLKRTQEEGIGWLAWSWGAVDNSDCGAPNSVFDITLDGKFGNWATTFASDISVADTYSIKNTSIIPASMLDATVASCGITYTINATSAIGGTIIPSGTINLQENANQIFDINADFGYEINQVIVDGVSVGNVSTYTFTGVRQNHTIDVTYTALPLPDQEPYLNTGPQAIPGKINPVNYDKGGHTVAYFDTTEENQGGGIRLDQRVDTENGGDGGNIGYIQSGEWLEFTVNVAETGIYSADVLVASPNTMGRYHLEFGGIDATGIQQVPNTGSYSSYTTKTISNISLTKGEQVMRLFFDDQGFNISSITFKGNTTTPPSNTAPIARATVSTTNGTAPLAVTFDANTSSDTDGDALTYAWDFGDGNNSTGVTANHNYVTPGTFTATLTVSDGNLTASTTKVIEVIESTPTPTPTAAFTVSTSTGIAPLAVTFDGSTSSDSANGSLSYAWDFGNTTTATSAQASTTYSTAGEFTVTLTVTNPSGIQNSTSQVISVTSSNSNTPSCNFGTPTAEALPSIVSTYKNIHILGTGGPNLDNVTQFSINWDIVNNGLYQLSMTTNNGKPNWWTSFLPNVTKNLNVAQPSIIIANSGFSGLDGDYWATLDNGNFVLASKTGGFTLYFSNSATIPNCSSNSAKATANTIATSVYPNPLNRNKTNLLTLFSNTNFVNPEILISTVSGKNIKTTILNTDTNQITIDVAGWQSGLYIINIIDQGRSSFEKIVIQ